MVNAALEVALSFFFFFFLLAFLFFFKFYFIFKLNITVVVHEVLGGLSEQPHHVGLVNNCHIFSRPLSLGLFLAYLIQRYYFHSSINNTRMRKRKSSLLCMSQGIGVV